MSLSAHCVRDGLNPARPNEWTGSRLWQFVVVMQPWSHEVNHINAQDSNSYTRMPQRSQTFCWITVAASVIFFFSLSHCHGWDLLHSGKILEMVSGRWNHTGFNTSVRFSRRSSTAWWAAAVLAIFYHSHSNCSSMMWMRMVGDAEHRL